MFSNFKQSSSQRKIALLNRDGYKSIEVVYYWLPHRPYIHQSFFWYHKIYISIKCVKHVEGQLPRDLFYASIIPLLWIPNFVTHFVSGDRGYIKMQTGEKLPLWKWRKEMVLNKFGAQK